MKAAKLILTPELFVEFAKVCKPGRPRRLYVKQNALPIDASIERLTIESNGNIGLIITSQRFADVQEAGAIPILPAPVFKAL
jgi:hypothetical protein